MLVLVCDCTPPSNRHSEFLNNLTLSETVASLTHTHTHTSHLTPGAIVRDPLDKRKVINTLVYSWNHWYLSKLSTYHSSTKLFFTWFERHRTSAKFVHTISPRSSPDTNASTSNRNHFVHYIHIYSVYKSQASGNTMSGVHLYYYGTCKMRHEVENLSKRYWAPNEIRYLPSPPPPHKNHRSPSAHFQVKLT